MKEDIELKELKIDEWIWVVFITLSLLNIFGDELKKDYQLHHTDKSFSTSRTIFTITIFVSFLIYVYLVYRNYSRWKRCDINSKKYKFSELNFFGSCLVVIASFIFLYVQVVSNQDSSPSLK